MKIENPSRTSADHRLSFMTELNWSQIPPSTYERMNAVLISTLNPDAERIDGAGGDEGRDVQLRRAGHLDLWELKSHNGRVGRTQRRQIERSLQRAAKLDPDSLEFETPVASQPTSYGIVVTRPILGGLHHAYGRAA